MGGCSPSEFGAEITFFFFLNRFVVTKKKLGVVLFCSCNYFVVINKILRVHFGIFTHFEDSVYSHFTKALKYFKINHQILKLCLTFKHIPVI